MASKLVVVNYGARPLTKYVGPKDGPNKTRRSRLLSARRVSER